MKFGGFLWRVRERFDYKDPDVKVNNLFEIAKDKVSRTGLIVRSLLKK
jgi:hypothetical protein